MRIFRFIAQICSGKPSYCEDCSHCIPGDKWSKGKSMCEANPIEVDCSERDTYVNRGAKVEIINTYKSCEEVRRIKVYPLIYDPACWKFDKKV